MAPRADLVSPEAGPLPDPRIHVAHADVVDRANPRYHDPALLAQAVIDLYRAKVPRAAATTDTFVLPDRRVWQEETGEYPALTLK